MNNTRAFTLIELLVSTSIFVILAALSVSAFQKSRRSGDRVREVEAGRMLMAAYLNAANANDGELLPGVVPGAQAVNETGQPLSGPSAERYPWRLLPFLGGRVFGTLLVNDQAKLGQDADRATLDYLVSFAPTFGMNATYVGGNFRGSLTPGGLAERRFGRFCVTRMSEVVAPSRLIVFASAHFTGASDKRYLGYHTVNAPCETRRIWSASAYKEDAPAESLGYIHPRHYGRAVAVMFDGHTELLTPLELEDMRRWSNQAAELDNPGFMIGQN